MDMKDESHNFCALYQRMFSLVTPLYHTLPRGYKQLLLLDRIRPFTA